MAISLRQLEYFVTVIDEGSFTRAAELLQVSQPGLSHQIQALERELGGPLLERLPRKVRLTPAGRTALPHAQASLAHAQRASSAARRALGVETGELHVGTLYSISTRILPGALRTSRRDFAALRRHPATPRPPGTPATVRLHPGPPRPDHRRLRRRDRGRNPCDTSPHHRPARTASQLLTSTRYAPGKRPPPRAGRTRDPGLT